MSMTKITESIGMMKGLTDGVCTLIQNASVHLPGTGTEKMRNLFENKLLIIWCSLLLRATTDVREAMQRYLCHNAFDRYFFFKLALKGEFFKHLTSNEKTLVSLRSVKEQSDFEANTRRYVEEANLSLMAVRNITVLPQIDRDMLGNGEMASNRIGKRNVMKKRQIFSDDHGMGPPPKKRRKKTRYQLFREDGTPRRRQQNPCDRRICKRMWQSDGVTRGCGRNSHPRGVCRCWKRLDFTKADEKNGGIMAWLEERYGKKYTM